ncbi:MAG: hypothetical protein ACK5P6_01610 [Pseudobdellovibrionaceae bacterium]
MIKIYTTLKLLEDPFLLNPAFRKSLARFFQVSETQLAAPESLKKIESYIQN